MYLEDFKTYSEGSDKKVKFLNESPFKYFLAAFLAGIFAGLGCIFTYTVGAMTSSTVFSKVLMGVSFGGTLCIIYYGGTELFTGNNMLMTAGILTKRVKILDLIKLWIICWLGNLIGSVVFAYLFYLSGLFQGELADLIIYTAHKKVEIPALQLFIRAIFCNVFVCLATWCSVRFKSEVSKIIIIFWCLDAFLVTGYEHSVANMSILFYPLLSSAPEITIGGYFYNLSLATLGNIVGGASLAIIYYFITKPKDK